MKNSTYLTAAIAATSGLLFGFDIAVINGALIFLRRDFHLSELQTESAASALLVGCVLGASLAGWLSDRNGRRRTLWWAAALFAISSIAAALPRTIGEFSAARVAGGVAIGVASMLAPLYIAEISPAKIRGRLVSFNQLAIVIGILAAYGVNWLLSFAGTSSWRWMFATAAIPSVLLFVGLLFVPESPRWLVEQGRDEEAAAVLESIEGKEHAAELLDKIKIAVGEGTAPFRELFQHKLRRPLAIAVGIAILQQITGINTVLFYGSVIFESTIFPQSVSVALAANITLGAINLLATIAALFLIDRLGRKPLIIGSAACMGVCEVLMAWGFRNPSQHPYLILITMLLSVAAFAIGLGPAPWVLIAEIFPTRLRGRAMSVANISLWASCLLVTSTFLTFSRHAGTAGAFCVYGSLCAVTVVFIAYVAPETSGMTLEEIEDLWH